MNSVETQIMIQYLEAIRQEQKKTTDVMVGIGLVFIVLALLILFWK